MSREHDPLALGPHWRVDLRLTEELPEDKLVGTRFIVHLLFSATTISVLLLTGWLGYLDGDLRYQIRDWQQRIKDNSAERADIQKMQVDYAGEAGKIDAAWQLVRPQLHVYDFIANLGRTRPEPMLIETIEWNDTGITVRGSLRVSADIATNLLSGYIKRLNHDPKIGPLFREIKSTDLSRGGKEGLFHFEISFRLKNTAAKP